MSPSSAVVFTGKVNTNNWLQISATEQWEWKADCKVFSMPAIDTHVLNAIKPGKNWVVQLEILK